MSTPDYDQFAEDHQCLLIVIKQIGPQMNPSLFNLIFDRLTQLYEFKITDNKGMGFERTVRLRYKQSYSIENNDWGDFQAHRRLVGLITIARSFNDNEIESICELHNTIRDTYANTLFDSRCFVIRNSPPSTNENAAAQESNATTATTNDVRDSSSECETQRSDFNFKPEFGAVTQEEANESPLFDFPLGDSMFMSSSDHTSFSTHVVNRSSSSSSLSSQASSVTSSPNKSLSSSQSASQAPNYEAESQQPSSLPYFEDHSTAQTEANVSLPNSAKSRSRTHSRNKSFDSRLLLNSTNSSNANNLQTSIANRTHSSSSSSLYKSSSRENLSSTTASTTNEYIRYESEEQCCEQIESRMKEFITGLFWVLESKRLDRASEKMDKIPLLMAPFEKKDLIGLDTDTRSFRRKCMGRMRKHIADLSLLAGLPQESLCNYLSAIEQLKAVNDKLWLAAAYEGLCSASLVLLYPDRWQQIHTLRRQFHFDKNLFNDLVSRCDYDVARSEVGQAMKKIAFKELPIEECLAANKSLSKSILTVEQFYERYKEAASHYAMYRGAAILEFECSFKAARTLIFFERFLKAADFIQNAVFITFQQSTEDQIERLLQISQLYENIRFYRKAAFYKRFAALKSVSLHIKSPNWDKCYFLLLPALHGYGVTLDPVEYDRRQESNQINWSGIHVQLVQEMITTSLKMQNETLAMRHLSFMLQCLFNHISPTQRQEFATKLSSLASRCGEGSPVILKLNNGAVIPSVNFTKFPTVIFFKVEQLAPYLRPVKLRLKSKESEEPSKLQNSGPFIYTPLQLNRTPKKNGPIGGDSVTKVAFHWAEGNTGKITLSLHNFLPIEMNISSITVMTDGVVFEPNYDTSLKISAHTSCNNISLTGIPRASGTLDILGYKLHALGIKSDCRLAQLPNAKKLKLPSKFAIEVVPRLPLMCSQCLADDLTEDVRTLKGISSTISSNDPIADLHISNSTYIQMFTGQRQTYQMKLSNISRNNDELIDFVDLEVLFPKHVSPQLQKMVQVEWSSDELNNALPIGRDLNIAFNITISVKGDFVFQLKKPNKLNNEHTPDKSSTAKLVTSNNLLSTSKKSQVLGSTKLASLINEFQNKKFSTDSNSSSPLPSNKGNDTDSEPEYPKEIFNSKIIEFYLRFDYSGGPGLNSGFCRQTGVHFVIEVLPSVLITHWDVLAAEQPDECYLVFDALNATEHELNLLYAQNKEMLIEPREKCRIPVPIKRCPLNLSSLDDEDDDVYSTAAILSRRYAAQRAALPKPQVKPNVDFLSYIFPTERKLKAILNRSRLHLRDQIDLLWRLPFSDQEGTVSIDEVPYSNEMLKSLLIPPIQSEIEINNLVFRSSLGEIGAKVGEQISIQTRLQNTSETSLHLLRLYLFCYQDYQNASMMTNPIKSRNYNMNSKLVINGCDSLCIDQLASQDNYQHECGLIFLYTGIYKLEICCLPEDSFKRMSAEQKQQSRSEMHNYNCQSLFTCLHTIEITVEE